MDAAKMSQVANHREDELHQLAVAASGRFANERRPYGRFQNRPVNVHPFVQLTDFSLQNYLQWVLDHLINLLRPNPQPR